MQITKISFKLVIKIWDSVYKFIKFSKYFLVRADRYLNCKTIERKLIAHLNIQYLVILHTAIPDSIMEFE